MKPASIGIVGGAGPMAGVFLLQRLFSLAGSLYGCHRDADFPEVLLISFPFSEMLIPPIDRKKVEGELSQSLARLRSQGCSLLAIACNTLHTFLTDRGKDLIHLPQMIASQLSPSEVPLVLCSSTSAATSLHRKFFPCDYPSLQEQREVEAIIDSTLAGNEQAPLLQRLFSLIERSPHSTVVLGCTELSLYYPHLPPLLKKVLDPLELTAHQLLKQSFQGIPCRVS